MGEVTLYGLGVRVLGVGFGVSGLGFWCSGCRVRGFGVWDLGVRVGLWFTWGEPFRLFSHFGCFTEKLAFEYFLFLAWNRPLRP